MITPTPESAATNNKSALCSSDKKADVSPQTVHCALCGADDYTVLFNAGEAQSNQIVQCRQCGLMYANPRENAPDVEDITSWNPDWELISKDRFRLAKEELTVFDYRDTRDFLKNRYPERGRLVEVGGGLGFLSNAFREDGWDVALVEPWKEACLFAESRFGLETRPKTLDDAGFDNASVDVLVMVHVIEHLPDPAATIAEVYRILKPGGMLVVETPRYDSLMFRLLGRRERSLSCSGHIYFFTNNTLQKLGERCGFRHDSTRIPGRSLSLDRLLWNLGVISKSESVKNVLLQLSSALKLEQMKIYLNMGDMVRMYFIKP
jgi:SAM-dependent methyltransferase